MASYTYNSITLPISLNGKPQLIILASRAETISVAELFAQLLPFGLIKVRQHRFQWPDNRKQLVEMIKTNVPLTLTEDYDPFLILDCATTQPNAHGPQHIFSQLQHLGHIPSPAALTDYISPEQKEDGLCSIL